MQETNAELERQLEALEISEERFRLLVEGTRDYAIFMLDPAGRIASWNPGAKRFKQYTAEEIIGQHFSRFYPEEDVQAGKPAAELRIATAEGRYEEEGWRIRKDGSRYWANVVITALRDANGNLRGFSKITRDLTERQKAEEIAHRLLEEAAARRAAEQSAQVIEQQREQLRVTLTSIGDAVITTDAEGRVTLLNPVAEAMTGWPNAEAAGQPLATIFHIVNEMTRHVVEDPVAKVLAGGGIVGLANHTLLIARDGSEYPVDDSAAPIRGTQGRLLGVVLVFRCIAERRRAEEALRRTAEQLQIVTDAMSAPVTRCSRDLRYQWVSKPYADWLGRPAEDIVNCPIVDIVGPQAFEQLRPHFKQVLAGQVVRYEQRVEFRGIGQRWIDAVYTPTLDRHGVPDGWVAVISDIDERKKLEESLRDADRRKTEFLAILAHELRNPLAPICNALELLHRSDGDMALIEKARSIMGRQLDHMVHLVDDLLDLSRISRGKVQLRKERVELAAIFQSAVEAVRSLIEAQGQELKVTLPPEPLALEADPTRLAQVVANLLSNAAKYTEQGGHIWLTAARQDDQAVIRVRDTGIGIAAEHLAHIFEMFSQVAPTLERSDGGLGIGLSLVKGLVELHGGQVEAHSGGRGRGSEFIVHLPIGERSPPHATGTAAQGSPVAGSRNARILVVDDNRDAADSTATVLSLMGHETRIAYDGLEGVQAAAQFQPAVVLLDIGLPRMNGYEVARHIRQRPWGRDMVLIALTGWGQDEDKRQALEAGFNHHLTKPVDVAALERLLALVVPAQ